ncbi:hypothetical protein [Phytoactinopolyspora halotolerans]|uniref:DUF624 domain-containing protein n=1 Tax=Phytoactinopolyspora halotolerans TaxID=1981512 RepID=A0A6L9SCF4_9ACTN|nr:hypothetical protein [Phytoactinopolyspora halotolerans]NEE02272.1 hypothetical protein [Phytoactinopolyspora halotolerans]
MLSRSYARRPTARDRRAATADGSALRWPGAADTFALLAEALWVGVLVTAVGLPIVTLPAALAAGGRHLGRFIRAEDASLRLFFADLRAGLRGGVLVGCCAVVAVAVFGLDLVIGASGALPGGPLVLAVGTAGLVATGVVVVQASALWRPETGWTAAIRAVPSSLRADVSGAALLVAALGLTVLAAWQLPPLIVPALGCLVFAAQVLGERRALRRDAGRVRRASVHRRTTRRDPASDTSSGWV